MGRQLPQPTIDSIDLTRVLSALADPVRLELMREMHRRGEPMTCSGIAENVEVSAATVSHHWKVLRDAGLTSTVAEGRHRIIEIRYDDLEERFPGLLSSVLDADA